MKRTSLLFAALCSLIASHVCAAPFELEKSTIDAGGGIASSARFTVTGTLGQPDADRVQPSASTSGRFTARGGFWGSLSGGGPLLWVIFSDGFED